jgi:hypothetical protein
MAAKINMRGVQEGVEDGVKQASDMSRKAFLAALGFAGLGFDLGKSIMNDSSAWLEKAERRGESVEQELRKMVAAYQQDFPGEVMKLSQNVQTNVNDLARNVTAQTQRINAVMSRFVGDASDSLGETVVDIQVNAQNAARQTADMVQDTVDSVQKNGADAVKSLKIETPAAMEAAVESAQKTVDSAMNKVWKGYDDLSVKDILAGLEGKSMSTLEQVREHEIAGKNRVTVIREIDAHIQAMTS